MLVAQNHTALSFLVKIFLYLILPHKSFTYKIHVVHNLLDITDIRFAYSVCLCLVSGLCLRINSAIFITHSSDHNRREDWRVLNMVCTQNSTNQQ